MNTKLGTRLTGPTFCWHCGKRLRRAPGKGVGMFYHGEVRGPDGHLQRVHVDCVKKAIEDGNAKAA